MAVIHANQPGAVHNIERGTITDADISDNAAIQARKIQNFASVAVASHLNLTDVTADQHHARSHDHSVAADGTLAFAAPGSSAVGDTVAAGTATTPARSDHRHGREAFATNAIVLGATAAAGVATTLIRSDDTIAAFDATVPTTSAVGDTAAVGTVARAARRDHTHGREAFATNALVLGTTAAAGVATTPMRRDDTIAAFDATVPVTQASGDAAATGTIAFAARRDHRHGMPTLLAGTPTVTIFTASGTWTRAAGTAFVKVIAVGSGGGGGGAASAGNASSAGGGGGGSYAEKWMTGTAAGASQTVTIGAAGSGGAAGNNAGTAGADCSFGTLVVGKGGAAGGGSADNGVGAGGAGGIAGTGDFSIPGQAGAGGFHGAASTISNIGGDGGSTVFGAGGRGRRSAEGAGVVGSNYGSGGSGAVASAANQAGAAGAAGIVIVVEIV